MRQNSNRRTKIKKIINLLSKEFKGQNPKVSNSDPLDVLIATILSQNTTDKTSYKAFLNLKRNFKNWEQVLSSPIKEIKKSIKVCGLTNQKSKTIKNILSQIKNEHGHLSLEFIRKQSNDEIFERFIKYNGVGTNTIACVLAFALGRDICPVDTHVHRISNRVGIVNTRTADVTFKELNKLIPKGKKNLLHTLLIKFGRKICKSNNPACYECIIYNLCRFKHKSTYLKNKGNHKENNFIILEHV